MRFRGRDRSKFSRRMPRSDAFRSRDLVKVIGEGCGPWLKEEGFKRLGSNGWVRCGGDEHHIIAVQCSQSGWDPRAGNRFIVEFERSRTPSRATGFARQRLWRLLDDLARREALTINNYVAQTLPPPDDRFLRALPKGVRDHYLRSFAPTTQTADLTDVWFAYYDEPSLPCRHCSSATNHPKAPEALPRAHRQFRSRTARADRGYSGGS